MTRWILALLTLGALLASPRPAAAQGGEDARFHTVSIGVVGTLCKQSSGSGAPNGSVVGSPCDLYLQTTGALWLKVTGVATNTGWSAFATASACSVATGAVQYYASGLGCNASFVNTAATNTLTITGLGTQNKGSAVFNDNATTSPLGFPSVLTLHTVDNDSSNSPFTLVLTNDVAGLGKAATFLVDDTGSLFFNWNGGSASYDDLANAGNPGGLDVSFASTGYLSVNGSRTHPLLQVEGVGVLAGYATQYAVKTANYTVDTGAGGGGTPDSTLACSSSSADLTLTLTAANGALNNPTYGRRQLTFLDESTSHNCLVTRAGSDTINGNTTMTLTPGQAATIQSNGSNEWFVLNSFGMGVSWPLLAPSGTNAAPSYSWSVNSGMGVYAIDANTMAVTGTMMFPSDVPASVTGGQILSVYGSGQPAQAGGDLTQIDLEPGFGTAQVVPVGEGFEGLYLFPKVTTAATGTHAWMKDVEFDVGSWTSGGATVTNGANVYIDGAPTLGTNKYALYVAADLTSVQDFAIRGTCTGCGSGVTSVAMTVPTGLSVSGSPITTTGTLGLTWSGTIPASSLPNPSATTLGGVESIAAVSHEWVNTISTAGVPNLTQPAFTDISGSVAAAQLPNPSASTLGGIQSFAAVSHEWIHAISTSGVPSATQPAFSDLASTPTTFAGYGISDTLANLGTAAGFTVSGSTTELASASGSFTSGNCVQSDASHNLVDSGTTNCGGGGSGTVTSVSVVGANGLAGTVATATTTPAITLSTSVTGLVKGNGTALAAATAGTDYVAPQTTFAGYGISDTANNLATAISSQTTGTGNFARATSPTFVTPALGTPSALVLTNATGLPVAGGGTGATTLTGLVVGNGTSPMTAYAGASACTSHQYVSAISAAGVTTCALLPTYPIGFTVDGAGSAITTGTKGTIFLPSACTITQSTLMSTDASNTTGSLVLDIWVSTSFPPSVANTITASDLPTLSSANLATDTTLTGWTLAIAAGSYLTWHVNSASTVTRVTGVLTCQQ